MSIRSIKVLSVLPLLGQPRHSKRISMLQEVGFTVQAVAFERDYHEGRLPSCPITTLGKIRHGHYLARMWAMIKSLRTMRANISYSDLVYASGLDMAFLSLLAGWGLQRPVVIEIGDVREIQLMAGVKGAVVRTLDRWIVNRCRLLVSTSPDFVTEYYEKRIGIKIPSLVIENKLEISMMGEFASIPSLPRIPLKERPLRIGYFGLLRCDWSWSVLVALAKARPNDIEIVLAGLVISPSDMEAQVKSIPNVTYIGQYKSPHGLPALYNQIDLVWACYPPIGENDWNLRWARPNRFYEACFFQRPMVSRSGSNDARYVLKHDIGLVLDAQTPEDLVEVFRRLNHNTLSCWTYNIKKLPESVYLYTSESSDLKKALSVIINPAT
jgi:succinoglycan biosynthesis protein ExoL